MDQHGTDRGALPRGAAEKVPGEDAVLEQQPLGRRQVCVMV
ncbi:hypothetical protein [Flavonifractor sp. An92]|nr:hypothetical protein [Flavonifractor sp. An92]